MAYNDIQPGGSTKGSKPDSGNANIRTLPVLGIVKDNIDPIRSGRLRVYIADFSSRNDDDASSWIPVRYLSPFYGRTEATAPSDGWGSFKQNPSSYGMWSSPPDIGTTVICIFVNGDMNYGYYIGCVPEPEALHMVPAIGGSSSVILNEAEAVSYGGASKLPVTNINTNNKKINNSTNFLNESKPVHSYAAAVLMRQGLIRDPVRGVISSSAQRETPSRVGFGVSTPGRPIYAGGYTDEELLNNLDQGNAAKLQIIARRGGHSFVMDDGDKAGQDQLVRIRSAMGHQILMSDDGQCLFIIHSNGQSWIELGKEGTIDMYSSNSVNIRTQGDLNLHADRNININAAKALNISADSIAIESTAATEQRVGSDFKISAGSNYTVKAGAGLSLSAASEASIEAGSAAYVTGNPVNLNTGATSLTPEVVKAIPIIAHPDTLYDNVVGYAVAPGALNSIVSRAPAHAPWVCAGQGVDVKVSSSSSSALPAAASPSVEKAIAKAGAAPVVAGVSVITTVPGAAAISSALDAGDSAALVAQTSVMAAAPLAAASAAAAAAYDTAAAKVVSGDALPAVNPPGTTLLKNQTGSAGIIAIGNMAQTASQLESAGVLKAGSAALVDSLQQQGKSVADTLAPNLFTGTAGKDLASYVNNASAQVGTAVASMQKAQTQATSVGLVTGAETASAIGGIVLASSKVGIDATAKFVSGAAATAAAVTSALGSVSSLISGGTAATKLADTVTGGLGSLQTSINKSLSGIVGGVTGAVTSAKGLVAGAFSAVTSSFKALAAGVPQNLSAIAAGKDAASAVTANAPAGSVVGALVTAGTGIANAAAAPYVATATNAINKATGIVSGVSNLAAKAGSAVSGAASGINALPGGINAIASVSNNAPGAINAIPGLSQASSAIASATSSVTNGIAAAKGALSSVTGALSSATSLISGGINSLSAKAGSLLSAASGASLGAALSSMFGGGSSTKMPSIAVNTYDTAALTDKAKGLVGQGVPSPTYGAASAGAISAVEKFNESIAKLQNKQEEARQFFINVVTPASEAFTVAKMNLPEGDPEISKLYIARNVAISKWTDMLS